MREHDHHHAVDDLLALSVGDFVAACAFKNFRAEDAVNEIFHHYVHIFFGGCGKSTRFNMLLPLLEIWALQDLLPVSVKLIKLVFEKLSHNSKARSIEEKVKLLIVFFGFSISNFNFGLLAKFFLCNSLFSWSSFFNLKTDRAVDFFFIRFEFLIDLFLESLFMLFNLLSLILHQDILLKVYFRFYFVCLLCYPTVHTDFWSVYRAAKWIFNEFFAWYLLNFELFIILSFFNNILIF